MEFTKKLYRVRHSGGGLTNDLYTKKEAIQIISQQGGELVPEQKGGAGCWTVLISIAIVWGLLALWLCG